MSLYHLGKKRVLVVEDNTFNMQLLQTLLEKISDLEIVASYDGANALKVLQSPESKIDMILLDIRLPIVTGEDVLREIRKNSDFDDIPVFAISVDQSKEAELKELGISDFIHKPFDIEELENKISLAFNKTV
ncbi:two-component hybrid sensor and regulator [hydrothermal vent metagenome]|uniref:Two-component hybrid sensor and regulator n=1 Tax=hydrothermal vent metagenome TaxID=652676 RepID=A0A1W1C2K7_9ZZZZ